MKPCLIFLVVLLARWNVEGFVANSAMPRTYLGPILTQTHTPRHQEMALFDSSNVDGTGRGSVIFAAVLLTVVWSFSIPPEFRRAVLCPSACEDNPNIVTCRECVTFDDWKTGIQDYYKNGGGINFDFSIDPKTKAQFRTSTGLDL